MSELLAPDNLSQAARGSHRSARSSIPELTTLTVIDHQSDNGEGVCVEAQTRHHMGANPSFALRLARRLQRAFATGDGWYGDQLGWENRRPDISGALS
jgi:hypothetical protein